VKSTAVRNVLADARFGQLSGVGPGRQIQFDLNTFLKRLSAQLSPVREIVATPHAG
jgi:hypothetical protein